MRVYVNFSDCFFATEGELIDKIYEDTDFQVVLDSTWRDSLALQAYEIDQEITFSDDIRFEELPEELRDEIVDDLLEEYIDDLTVYNIDLQTGTSQEE